MNFIAATPPLTLSIPHATPYVVRMSGFFFVAMIVAMFLTLAVLVIGLVGMVKGGEFNAKYGNKLMRARVFMQAIAIVLFALAVMAGKS